MGASEKTYGIARREQKGRWESNVQTDEGGSREDESTSRERRIRGWLRSVPGPGRTMEKETDITWWFLRCTNGD